MFDPNRLFGFTTDEEGNIIASGAPFADYQETGNTINAASDAINKSVTLTDEQKSALTAYLQGLGGALFGEDGQAIFPEFPADAFNAMLMDAALAQSIGPIISTIVSSRSVMMQNAATNATNLQLEQYRQNPFNRSLEQDTALQEMLARGGLTSDQIQAQYDAQFNPFGETAADRLALQKAQFNPYGYASHQGLDAISRQFNPYGEGSADRLALQKAQFNPFGQDAADRLALQEAQFNPYGRSQLEDQQLQALLARGGLSSDERLLEIQASNAPLNRQNILSFLGDPSAVGSAVALGGQGFFDQLSGTQGQSAVQTGGAIDPNTGQRMSTPSTGGQVANLGGAFFNPNAPTPTANTLRGFSDEGIELLQGSAAGRGVTPSRLSQLVGSVTPGGGSATRGGI